MAKAFFPSLLHDIWHRPASAWSKVIYAARRAFVELGPCCSCCKRGHVGHFENVCLGPAWVPPECRELPRLGTMPP